MVDKKHRTLAIIPARKDSKRLPGKNFKELGGLPLFTHSVNYGRINSEIIDEIIISTDDPIIIHIAKKRES